LEFIEAQELQLVYEDSANVLMHAYEEKRNEIVAKIGLE
jgi:hypothetical protein